MEIEKLLWGVTTLLLGILTLLHKVMREDMKELRKENEDLHKSLADFVLCEECEKSHDRLVRDLNEKHSAFDRSCDKIHANILTACEKNHDALAKHAHVHGSLGSAGEVINK